MKLLIEVNENIEYLTENVNGEKQYFLEGVFLQGNIKNRNGRYYPTNLLESRIGDYSKNFIDRKRAFGELNHPPTPTVNLDKVSHIITSLVRENNNFIGKAKILDTPNGRIVKSFMDEGCTLGVSSRGLGSLKSKGNMKMVEDFYISTAGDIVADPSAPDAFLENVVENIEWVFENGSWIQKEKSLNLIKEFKTFSSEEREEKALDLIKKLLNN